MYPAVRIMYFHMHKRCTLIALLLVKPLHILLPSRHKSTDHLQNVDPCSCYCEFYLLTVYVLGLESFYLFTAVFNPFKTGRRSSGRTRLVSPGGCQRGGQVFFRGSMAATRNKYALALRINVAPENVLYFISVCLNDALLFLLVFSRNTCCSCLVFLNHTVKHL